MGNPLAVKKKDLLEFIDSHCNLATSPVPDRSDAATYRKFSDPHNSAAPADLTNGMGIYETRVNQVVEDVLSRLKQEDKLIDPSGSVKITDATKVGDIKGMKGDRLVTTLKDLLGYVGAQSINAADKEAIINALKGLKEKNGK